MRDRRKTTRQGIPSSTKKKKKEKPQKILKKIFLSKSPNTPQTLRDFFFKESNNKKTKHQKNQKIKTKIKTLI